MHRATGKSPSAFLAEDAVSVEQLSAMASIGTLVVVTAASAAAFVQLRHLRRSKRAVRPAAAND
jgi:hypothetical protein